MTTVVGVFETRLDAEQAVAKLKDEGFYDHDISLLAEEDKPFMLKKDYTQEGAVAGVVVGTAVGAAFGLAALALPGVGTGLADGLLVCASGAVSGAGLGLLAGAIAGRSTSVREREGQAPDRHTAHEDIVVVVEAPEFRSESVREIFQLHRDISSHYADLEEEIGALHPEAFAHEEQPPEHASR